jgi:hypothetical protein
MEQCRRLNYKKYGNEHCNTNGCVIPYDIAALNKCCKYIEENHILHPMVYIMACRIGPIAAYFYKKFMHSEERYI